MGTGYQRLTRGEGRHDDEVWHCRFSISRHLTDSIVTLKLVFERFDVPLFEALGAELGAKQADGAVLERKAALVAAGGVPRPLFRSPNRTIATGTATPLISGGAVKGSADWLDPEEPSRWLPAFLKRWNLRPRKPRCVPGSAPTGPGRASGVREGSGSWREKGPGASPGIRNGIRVVRDGSNGAVIPVPGREELAGNLQLNRGAGGFRWIQIP